jgi:hypothetical protein
MSRVAQTLERGSLVLRLVRVCRPLVDRCGQLVVEQLQLQQSVQIDKALLLERQVVVVLWLKIW